MLGRGDSDSKRHHGGRDKCLGGRPHCDAHDPDSVANGRECSGFCPYRAKAFGSEAGKEEGKKGADGGIDGMIVFTDDNSGKAKRVIVSVKGGGVNVSQIRDLGHVVEREKAAIGIFLTLEKPTKPMIEEAIGKGFYHSEGWNRDYQRIQIPTVEEILAGKLPNLPPNIDTFKKAGKVESSANEQNQGGLF